MLKYRNYIVMVKIISLRFHICENMQSSRNGNII